MCFGVFVLLKHPTKNVIYRFFQVTCHHDHRWPFRALIESQVVASTGTLWVYFENFKNAGAVTTFSFTVPWQRKMLRPWSGTMKFQIDLIPDLKILPQVVWDWTKRTNTVMQQIYFRLMNLVWCHFFFFEFCAVIGISKRFTDSSPKNSFLLMFVVLESWKMQSCQLRSWWFLFRETMHHIPSLKLR